MLSPEDEEKRKHRVTASPLAAYLGFHWYQSPSEAWEYHTGLREFKRNRSVEMGEYLEPGLVRAATDRLGWHEYTYPCETVVSPDYPWAAATPDVMLWNPIGNGIATPTGIQVKNQYSHMRKTYKGSPGTFGPADNTLIPPHMLAQCLWEMMVTGSQRWHFAAYLGGGDFWIFNIWRDQPAIDRLLARAFEFWRRHIDPDGPMERPSNVKWNPRVGRAPIRRKLTRQELLSQPIPKGG